MSNDFVYYGLKGLSVLLTIAGLFNPAFALAGRIAGQAADAEATIAPEVATLIDDFHGKVAAGTVTHDDVAAIAQVVQDNFMPVVAGETPG